MERKELNKIFHVLFSRYPAQSRSPENCPGPLRGGAALFFADAFEGALTKTEQNNLFLTLRRLMAYSVSQKPKILGRALEMPAGARPAAGGGR